ncbi:MAG: succinate dehydrogenase, cytochrome b556 subunit [Methylomonas sp.]|jgi:succinate dehydrogenase / fumarate reductase cytochrome b subunit|uniref:succinate dehydrogenase, cytochrome b556 subunit n=1 Tax=Methylomonas sp. TaxID=418 RepID=UPI0025E5F7BA|nr:succinate dehydrogenase, cytochrome b556 subunit [Methylomonas sp.]MCK9609457.1 succinate dehydrogenase, cytochrome b556 subunit [Methylomonas sp.]
MSANRPLSPHLQVYRLPLTGLISITHRMTGVLLSMGLLLFVYVLLAIAAGESTYLDMQAFMSFWLFKLVYWGFVYALFFHLCHGIRHLIWDVGKTFDRATMNRYALIELGCSAILTFAAFLLF